MHSRIEPGSIVEFNERNGEPAYIAIVQHVWQDNSLQLFVLHHQSTSNIRAASRDQCKLLIGPHQYEEVQRRLRELDNAMDERLHALENAVDALTVWMRTSDVEPTPGEPDDQEGDVVVAPTAKKPWPKGKRAIADPVPD